MLPEARRLRQRQELLVVQRRGSRRSTPSLVLHVAVGDRVRPARVGFIVPRAVGGAVVRNRVKRQLRHLVRSRLPGLAPGTELVVRARAAAAGRSSERLGRELDQALARLAGSA